MPVLMQGIMKYTPHLLNPALFTGYPVKNLGGHVITFPAPVLRFPGGEVEPGFQVGTRGNGVDQPRWPEDLMVEVVE